MAELLTGPIDLGRIVPGHRHDFEAEAARLGMLRADGQPAARKGRVVTRTHVIAPAGGVLVHESELGATVQSGARLGVITTLQGEKAADLVAPCAGMVMAHREALECQPGDPAYTMAVDVPESEIHDLVTQQGGER